jgi:tetratricopeptide (TPR) repeat protein
VLTWLVATSAGIFAVSIWRDRKSRRSRIDWSEAKGRSDWAQLERIVRNRLQRERLPDDDRARLVMTLAWILAQQDRIGEALEALDPELGAQLPARELATWISNRAYWLAMADRLDEALDELDRAELIVAGDEDIEARLTYTCVFGNRGLVALRRGQLSDAAALIERAHWETMAVLETLPQNDPRVGECREWHAERWLWLSEIAHKQGDLERARQRLEEAAALSGTHFGDRARKLLSESKPAKPQAGRASSE